jgi:probable rRNA maturation factor
MKVQIENRQNKVKIDRKAIRNTVSKVFRLLDCLDKEISICFTDDENIKELNRQYLNRNKPTNVLSFSLQEGEYGNINPQMLGDVIISVETARRDAASGNLTIEHELDFLLIHGILHLTGYNHENTSEKEIKRMELKEKELFNKIRYGSKTLI